MNKLIKGLAAITIAAATSTPSYAQANKTALQQPENTYQEQRVKEQMDEKYGNNPRTYDNTNHTKPRAGLFIPAVSLAIFPFIYRDIKRK